MASDYGYGVPSPIVVVAVGWSLERRVNWSFGYRGLAEEVAGQVVRQAVKRECLR